MFIPGMDRKVLYGLSTYRLEKQNKMSDQINDNYIDLMITYSYDPQRREYFVTTTNLQKYCINVKS